MKSPFSNRHLSGINNALIDIWNFCNSGILTQWTQVWCERITRASKNTDPLISQCGQIKVRSGKVRQLKESISAIPGRRLKADQALTASPLVYTGSKHNKYRSKQGSMLAMKVIYLIPSYFRKQKSNAPLLTMDKWTKNPWS